MNIPFYIREYLKKAKKIEENISIEYPAPGLFKDSPRAAEAKTAISVLNHRISRHEWHLFEQQKVPQIALLLQPVSDTIILCGQHLEFQED